MVVVIHQAVGVYEKVKARGDALDNAQKMVAIVDVEEDVLPGIAAGSDVIQRAREFDAKRSGHVARLTQSNAQNKI